MNFLVTGSKKTSIQQKISSFTTVKKPSVGASSSGSIKATSDLVLLHNIKSTRDHNEGVSNSSGNSKSVVNKKNGGAIHFGTLREFHPPCVGQAPKLTTCVHGLCLDQLI